MNYENENKWMLEGRTGYVLMHHGWKKGEELFRNQFSFGLNYDYATVTEKEAEEKAAFIVRAVNSHDSLVMALADALELLENHQNSAYCQAFRNSDESVLDACRAALAEAEKT